MLLYTVNLYYRQHVTFYCGFGCVVTHLPLEIVLDTFQAMESTIPFMPLGAVVMSLFFACLEVHWKRH